MKEVTHSLGHEALEVLVERSLQRRIQEFLKKIDRVAKEIDVDSAVLRAHMKPLLQKMLDKHF